MSLGSVMPRADNAKGAIAPWWYTALVLLVLAIGSVASARQHGLPNLNLPGMSVRLSGYVTVLAEEWFIVLIIWLALRHGGLSIAGLVSGRWQNLRAFLKDVGLAASFLIVGVPFTAGMARLLRADNTGAASILPKTTSEAVVWVAMAVTAAFAKN